MRQRRAATVISGATILTFLLAVHTYGQLVGGLTSEKDIGSPNPAGSTTVDARGGSAVYIIKGSGHDIWDTADDFHFAYRSVGGDGSVVARILGEAGGNPEWAKAGPMIRENDASGARNVMLAMTSGHGVEWQWRETTNDFATWPGFGDLAPRVFPTFFRLQRAGNDFTGFVSDDGALWKQVSAPRRLFMSPNTLFGLAVTSHDDGTVTTARFDNVGVQTGLVSPPDLATCSSSGAIRVVWSPLVNALGYNVYRGGEFARANELTRLNRELVTNTLFDDTSIASLNGVPATYAVEAVFRTAGGRSEAGPLIATVVNPVQIAPEYLGCSINEGLNHGAAITSTKPGGGQTIEITGSGGDIWNDTDSFWYLCQPAEGDFQVSVKALDKPTATHEWAKAGLMIRETLEANARATYLVLTPAHGLVFQYRGTTGGLADSSGSSAIDAGALHPPIWLRLTRKGDVITPEYSTNDGRSYQSAGQPFRFAAPLSRSLYVGLCITSHDASKKAVAHFSPWGINPL
jgi:regulation of enolase protein 1 (concanavalin A-like superfamily)